MQNNKQNYIFVGIVAVVVILAFLLFKHSPPAPQTSGDSTATSTDVAASSSSAVVSGTGQTPANPAPAPSATPNLLNGSVDLKEIGGTGLTVALGSRISMVTATGVFAAMPLATDTISIVTVTDSASKPRAYGIAFPNTKTLTLDARSTAETTLIDPTADLATAEIELADIDALKCFPAYVAYLQKELPTHSLDQLQSMTNANDASNPQVACVNEIQAMVAGQ